MNYANIGDFYLYFVDSWERREFFFHRQMYVYLLRINLTSSRTIRKICISISEYISATVIIAVVYIYKHVLNSRYIAVIILSRSVTLQRICRLMCWVNGGNEQSFFTAAEDSFRVTSVLYLRACVREQLFEAKAAGIFLPCFTRFARASKIPCQRCAE